VIVFLWSAGTAEGVADSPRKARRNAAASMRTHEADTALVEKAYYMPGIGSLETGYLRAGLYWTARRYPSGRVSWRPCQRQPEVAAS
jgi:hypothetical protein